MHTKINALPENWDRRGLPSWTYEVQGLFRIELEKVFGLTGNWSVTRVTLPT